MQLMRNTHNIHDSHAWSSRTTSIVFMAVHVTHGGHMTPMHAGDVMYVSVNPENLIQFCLLM